MTRSEICRKIEEIGLVPIVRVRSAELATRAVEAVLAGGVSIFEITMTVPGAVSLIRSLAERFGSRALIGAGTVLSAADAQACIDAGARFIVSPGFDAATVEAVLARDVAVMPGALTPTEVIAAWQSGADMVKLFPCSALGGAKYLKALRGPLPDVKLLPTGGVSLGTIHEYIAAGATALGVGSELVDERALEAGRDALLSERASALAGAVRAARAALSGS
jgi:2-dehydro-3-deoxyphosphogluconate aldolase/(4S)-4-hydroxy-2-oxoglutarate aldolase